MRRVNAGDFRHTVTVMALAPNSNTDDYGAPTPSYQELGKMRVKVEPMTGREYWAAAQVQAERTVRMTARWHPGWYKQLSSSSRDNVSVTCQIVFGNRTFNVKSVANVEERNVLMEIVCQEQVT
jgi:SPP1 family predicted phage head-tail adaptor